MYAGWYLTATITPCEQESPANYVHSPKVGCEPGVNIRNVRRFEVAVCYRPARKVEQQVKYIVHDP